jgi:DNA-binding transcriptional MerR regulator
MGLSIGKVAKMFELSRTTLLYYDSIGLLSPSDRSLSGYRIYSDTDILKLKQIVLYRDVGVPLNKIDNLISASENDFVSVLMLRLSDLNKQISLIKKQQDIIVRILSNVNLCKEFKSIDKNSWEEILNSIGMTEEQAMKWHADFEQNSPEQHQHLLTILGILPAFQNFQ